MQNKLAVLVLVLLAAGTLSLSADLPGKVRPRDPRIAGGSKANEGNFPHQASLRLNGRHVCGATIISQKALLTSAHCCKTVQGKKSHVEVEVGTIRIGRGTKFNVTRFLIHPSYEKLNNQNDICIAETNEAMMVKNAMPIDLGSTEHCKAGTRCTITGWGQSQFFGDSSDTLMFVHIPILSHRLCVNYGPLFENELMTCAGSIQDGDGFCHGDHGGPLVCGEKLCGVASLRFGCGETSFPSIYTKVPAFNQWINETIKIVKD